MTPFSCVLFSPLTLLPAVFQLDVMKVSLKSRIGHQMLSVLRTGHRRYTYVKKKCFSPIY